MRSNRSIFGHLSSLGWKQEVIALIVRIPEDSIVFRIASFALAKESCLQNSINVSTDYVRAVYVLGGINSWTV